MEKETFKKLLRIILKDRVSDEIISDIMFLFDEFTHGQTPVDIDSLKKDIFNEMQHFNEMPKSPPYYPAVSPAPAIPTIYADVCSCNPKNGGSGICGCTIGNKLLPEPNQSNTYTQTSWISTPTFNDPSATKKMNTTLFDKIYKDYEKGWLMTLNDPLSKEEFLQKLKSDKSFAESYIKQKADENNLSFDEIVKIIENELKPKQ